MRYALPLTALLALAACSQPAVTQDQINAGLQAVAKGVVCYRTTAGAVAVAPADAVEKAGIAAGMILSSSDCQQAIAAGEALVAKKKG
jgi:hypothetical protein